MNLSGLVGVAFGHVDPATTRAIVKRVLPFFEKATPRPGRVVRYVDETSHYDHMTPRITESTPNGLFSAVFNVPFESLPSVLPVLAELEEFGSVQITYCFDLGVDIDNEDLTQTSIGFLGATMTPSDFF